MIKTACTAALLFCASPVFANTADILPDPATITVPDLSGSKAPEVVKDGWKFFFFHKPGVSFANAHADFSDCYRFIAPTGYGDTIVGTFVPWREEDIRTDRDVNTGYAPLGGVIMRVFNIEGSMARGDRQMKMRRCMETRDYKRYGVARDIWEKMAAMEAGEAIAMQAKIASEALFNGEEPTK